MNHEPPQHRSSPAFPNLHRPGRRRLLPGQISDHRARAGRDLAGDRAGGASGGGVRCQPGAAGTVTNNLRAMGVNVLAAGIVGDDGEGFELLRALDMTGVNVDALVIRSDRFTPTYTKPMLREPDGSVARAEPAGHQKPDAAGCRRRGSAHRPSARPAPARPRRHHRRPGAGGGLRRHHRAGARRAIRAGPGLSDRGLPGRLPRAHRPVRGRHPQAERARSGERRPRQTSMASPIARSPRRPRPRSTPRPASRCSSPWAATGSWPSTRTARPTSRPCR